jgi:hypothetical protein
LACNVSNEYRAGLFAVVSPALCVAPQATLAGGYLIGRRRFRGDDRGRTLTSHVQRNARTRRWRPTRQTGLYRLTADDAGVLATGVVIADPSRTPVFARERVRRVAQITAGKRVGTATASRHRHSRAISQDEATRE